MKKSHTYKVFVVEDDKFYLELFKNYFSEKTNFNVTCFTSGEECISRMSENPDLIILDYFLDKDNPDAMNGSNVYKILKKHCPQTNVVIISAQQSTDVIFNLVKEGLRNYIMKNNQTFSELDQLLVAYA